MLLHEEVLLLALKDETGRIDWKAGNFQTVMAGAVIAELLLAERITIENGKKKLVIVLDAGPHENAVLNEALDLLGASKKRRNIQHWIGKLAALKGFKEKVAESLCRQGVLEEEKGKVLFIFPTTKYPELDPEPERQLIARLEKAIFDEEAEVDVRTALLISLTHASGILSVPFAGKALRKNKRRIREITDGELIGKATGEAVAAAEAAMAMMAILPAITVTTTSASGGSPGC